MKRRGFSLIEVLIAVFLVITCMLVVIATMPLATASRAKADLMNRAMGLAQKELEGLRGVGYSNLTPTQMYSYGLIDSTTPTGTDTYAFTSADALANDNPSKVLPNGTGSVKVEQMDFDLRRVTITITYKDRGTTRTVRLGTLVANL